MNSVRGSFAFATRTISIVFLLLLVAPYSPAQQGEDTSPEATLTAKAQRNQGRSNGQRPQGSGNPKAEPKGQRGPSENAPARPGSNRSGADDRGSSNAKGGHYNSAADTAAQPEGASEAESNAPPSNDRPGRRGPSADAPTRPTSSAEATNGRGSSNGVSGRGPRPSAHAPSQMEPATQGSTNTPASSPNDRPARRGPSAAAPGRTASPGQEADSRGPSTDRPGRQGPRSNAPTRPGNSTTADEKNASQGGRPNGSKERPSRITRANGAVIERDKNGRTTSVTTPRGKTARIDPRGHVTSIRDKKGNTISRGPRGERKVETVRADRSRVVSLGRRAGYVERPFDRGGRQYVRRTYVVGGRSYVRVYRGHYYHGKPYYVYVPPYYYSPAYYHWMYGPWPRPVYYHWGWYGSIWYRPHGYYFTPYPVYPYASLWLTDYLIAENLRLAYEADQLTSYQPTNASGEIALAAYHPASQTQSGSAVLTTEVKQMIPDEVKNIIAEQQKAATSSATARQADSGDEMPAALDPSHRVFVVFSVLEATMGEDVCPLTASDVVKRIENTPDGDNTVAVQVLASKRDDCAIGSRVRVQLTDLNDMLNHFREQVHAGMKILAQKQGKDGLPAAPPASPRAVPEGTAAADPMAAADLEKQEEEADQTETEVQQEASAESGSSN